MPNQNTGFIQQSLVEFGAGQGGVLSDSADSDLDTIGENSMNHLATLKDALSNIEESILIPTQKGPFNVTPVYKEFHLIGVEVDNLGATYSFIPIEVFVATLSLLYLSENQTASNGNAMTGNGHFLIVTRLLFAQVRIVVAGSDTRDFRGPALPLLIYGPEFFRIGEFIKR